MEIYKFQKCIKTNKYEISLHAQKERLNEDITIQEIENAILEGEIIENYPQDSRGASFLVLGYVKNRAIHIVCSILPNKWLRIITVYIPKTPKWKTPKQRRI